MRTVFALLLVFTLAATGCGRVNAGDVDPKVIEAKYGVTGGYVDEIDTEQRNQSSHCSSSNTNKKEACRESHDVNT